LTILVRAIVLTGELIHIEAILFLDLIVKWTIEAVKASRDMPPASLLLFFLENEINAEKNEFH
jgi:hypothetical protein